VAPFSSVTVPEEVQAWLKEHSMSSLRQALRIDPANAAVLAALARETLARESIEDRIAAGDGFLSLSEWYARQAVQKAPDSAESHWTLAEVLVQLNRLQAARHALEPALRMQPQNPNVLAVQAMLAERTESVQ